MIGSTNSETGSMSKWARRGRYWNILPSGVSKEMTSIERSRTYLCHVGDSVLYPLILDFLYASSRSVGHVITTCTLRSLNKRCDHMNGTWVGHYTPLGHHHTGTRDISMFSALVTFLNTVGSCNLTHMYMYVAGFEYISGLGKE
jgi:hypothetical protein